MTPESGPAAPATGTAWGLAHAAAQRSGVRLVELESLDDMVELERLTEAVWGTPEAPRHLARALQHAGGVLLAARGPDGGVVGAALGFVGTRGGAHLHSHLAGVLPSWQGRGIGRALKLGQRAACLGQGLTEMRWTYDPLLVRNAWFNLVSLGAVGTAFLWDFYGAMPDRQNDGDRGDRFEVRWDLRAPVGARPAGDADATPLLRPVGDATAPWPEPVDAEPGAAASVAVPPGYPTLRRDDPALAARWRDAAAAAFARCFAAGLVAVSISRDGVYRFIPPVAAADAAPAAAGPPGR